MIRRDLQRGQAVTELALGLLVFITILLFGIHFAEIGYLSVKVPQASAHALWESTGKRAQTIKPSSNKMSNIVPQAATAANDRFGDFDPARTGGNSVRLSVTEAKDMDVNCRTVAGSQILGNSGFWGETAGYPTNGVNATYQETGAIRCEGSAKLSVVAEFPREYQEKRAGKGFFKEAHYAASPLEICAVGRAIGGSCQGNLTMLLNDWGLVGNAEARDCPTGTSCPEYRHAVQSNFGGGGMAGAMFAFKYAGWAPTTANEFHMSYVGVENGYKNSVGGESGGAYNTGGPGGTKNGQWVPSTVGSNCFLGMPGC